MRSLIIGLTALALLALPATAFAATMVDGCDSVSDTARDSDGVEYTCARADDDSIFASHPVGAIIHQGINTPTLYFQPNEITIIVQGAGTAQYRRTEWYSYDYVLFSSHCDVYTNPPGDWTITHASSTDPNNRALYRHCVRDFNNNR